ncbi:MAG: ABC transporter ATP-binding protein [Verrucomicrobia bacterium]|nr:ABC transporter ATP-binding protein [Verrucomicrobiota bacterium]MDA1085630.1 ABC transporter ATP-binding protein [Verrucomicrobiota bacterium]
MLEVKNISKSYGPIDAVKDVSFSADQGEILGFLGPNGAGKSTTMRMITGFLTPSAGTAIVNGHDITVAPVAAKKLIGYLPENAPLYAEMTTTTFLRFVAELRGYSGRVRDQKVEEGISRCQLESVRRQPLGTLSKGFKQRVCMAQAIMHDPKVLIMDEPTDGLDPNQKHVVRNMIRDMAASMTIVVSTHILEEVDAICTRAIIISAGQLVANGTPDELRRKSSLHGAVELTLSDASSDTADSLRALPSADRVETERSRYIVYPGNQETLYSEVSAMARDKEWKVTGLRTLDGRLDDVFKQLTVGGDFSNVG